VRAALVALLTVAGLAVPNAAAAQTASDLYARAQKRAAAATAAPTIASLRAASGAYESIVRRHPRSGFCDDALWYGAATARLASERLLKAYHLLPAVRGDLLDQLGRFDEARAEFERAAGLTRNARERDLLLERVAACQRSARS
jgi:tetratricopeptide (TPR) repeat protein